MKITKRKDGYFQTNIYLSTDPITGRKVQKTIVSKSKSDCRKKALDFLSLSKTQKPAKAQTLAEFSSTYLSEHISNLKPGTRKLRASHVNNHIIPFFGDRILISAITPEMVQSFVNGIRMKPRTVQNIFSTLRSILERATELGLIQSNPARRTKLPKPDERKIRPLSESELSLLISSLGDDVYSDIIYIDAFTGLRIGEIMALTWDRIDFDKRSITVDRAFYTSKTDTEFHQTKNRKSRIVPMPESVFDRLLFRKYAQEKQMRDHPDVFDNPLGLVFTDSVGKRLIHKTVLSRLRKISDPLGFDGLRFHDLRHTYAVLNLRAGVDIKTLSESLGHASVSFTMDVYAFVTDSMRQSQAEKLSKFISNLTVF